MRIRRTKIDAGKTRHTIADSPSHPAPSSLSTRLSCRIVLGSRRRRVASNADYDEPFSVIRLLPRARALPSRSDATPESRSCVERPGPERGTQRRRYFNFVASINRSPTCRISLIMKTHFVAAESFERSFTENANLPSRSARSSDFSKTSERSWTKFTRLP